MKRVYERDWYGTWRALDTGEQIGSDVVYAALETRWRAQNESYRWREDCNMRVAMNAPDYEAVIPRKRKSADRYYRLAENTGAISTLLVIAIVVIVLLHFLRTLP